MEWMIQEKIITIIMVKKKINLFKFKINISTNFRGEVEKCRR